MAHWLGQTDIDFILVGDSAGMVVFGDENTLSVTVDDIVKFSSAVRKGSPESFIIADMPFLSYQLSSERAVENAGRLIVEGRADAVKIEGGSGVFDKIEAILKAGIAVQGHLGLTPQSVSRFGGYRVQGRSEKDAKIILEDAKKLEDLGVFSIVLEFIPYELAEIVTKSLKIPTVGIGSGSACDGQILVTNDILGLTPSGGPKFARKYADSAQTIIHAVSNFIKDVNSGSYPSEKETVRTDQEKSDGTKK